MNIIQATPSIYAARHVGSVRQVTHLLQKESVPKASPSVIVAIVGKPSLPGTYNEKGIITSPIEDSDVAQQTRDLAAKDAHLDENTRLSADIAAHTAYAYAVSLLYVNTTVTSYIVEKKIPKPALGIPPVSPASPYAAASRLTR